MIRLCLTLTTAMAFCLLLVACSESNPADEGVTPREPPAQTVAAPNGPGGGGMGASEGGSQPPPKPH